MFGHQDPPNHRFQETVGQTEALSRLLYIVENRIPFCLLEGDHGTGKTTVLKHAAAELTHSGIRAIVQNVSALNCRAALWHLCGALSILSRPEADESELMGLVRDELMARADCHHSTVVLLDDIHLAQDDIHLLLHLLTAVAEVSEGHFCVLAAAAGPVPEDFRKRSPLQVALTALDRSEAVEFAVRCLAAMECDVTRITSDGWQAIAELSEGLPGQITRLCRIVHTVASLQDDQPVDGSVIRSAAGQLLPGRAA